MDNHNRIRSRPTTPLNFLEGPSGKRGNFTQKPGPVSRVLTNHLFSVLGPYTAHTNTALPAKDLNRQQIIEYFEAGGLGKNLSPRSQKEAQKIVKNFGEKSLKGLGKIPAIIESARQALRDFHLARRYEDVLTLLQDPWHQLFLNLEVHPDFVESTPLINWGKRGHNYIVKKEPEERFAEYKKIIDLYIEKGANPNYKSTFPVGLDNTALMWSIANAHTQAAICFVQHPNVDISTRDVFSKTPLHFAIAKGCAHVNNVRLDELPLRVVIDELLTRAEKDPKIINAQDLDGNTPLHYAVIHRDLELIRDLKNSGADETLINGKGNKPIDMLNIDYGAAVAMLSIITWRPTIHPKDKWNNSVTAIKEIFKNL